MDENKITKIEKILKIIKDNFIFYDKKSSNVVIAMCLAEFLSTFIFVFLSCASKFVTLWSEFENIPHFQTALGSSFAYLAAIEFGGKISGAHVNPCITLAACLLGKKAWIELPIYVGLQSAGSLVAYGILKLMTKAEDLYYIPNRGYPFCCPNILPGLTEVFAFFSEFWATFFYILVCAGIWDSRNQNRIETVSIKLTLTYLALHLAFSEFTGCQMNPVKSISVALITMKFVRSFFVVFVVAPFAATLCAAILYRWLFSLNYKTEMGNWEKL